MFNKYKLISLFLTIIILISFPGSSWATDMYSTRDKLSANSLFELPSWPEDDDDGFPPRAGFMSLPFNALQRDGLVKSLRFIETIDDPHRFGIFNMLAAAREELIRICETQGIQIKVFSCQGNGQYAPLVFRRDNVLFVRNDLEDFLGLEGEYAEPGRLFVLAELRHDILGHNPAVVGEKVDTAAEEVYAFLVGELGVLLGFEFPRELTEPSLRYALEAVLTRTGVQDLIDCRSLMLEKIQGRSRLDDEVYIDKVLMSLLRLLAKPAGERVPELIKIVTEIYGYDEVGTEEVLREVTGLVKKALPQRQAEVPAEDDSNWQQIAPHGEQIFWELDVQGQDVWLRLKGSLVRISFNAEERVFEIEDVDRGYKVELRQKRPVRIGRHPDWSDLQIFNRGVSRRHLEVRLKTGRIYVKDVGSLNGFEYYETGEDKAGKEENDPPVEVTAEDVAELLVELPAELEYLAEIIRNNAKKPAEQKNIVLNRQEERYRRFFERAREKNVELLVAYSPDDARLPEYLERLLTIIEEIPTAVLGKAGKPLVYKVGRIESENVYGQADVRQTMGFAGAGMTQHAGALLQGGVDPLDNDSVSDLLSGGRYDKLRETVVHELIGHKLATVTRADRTLIMPKEDWARIMELNRAVSLQVFKSPEMKRQFFDYLERNYSIMTANYFDSYSAQDLAQMDDERFLYAIRNNYTFFQVYHNSLLEIVAFSAQDQDLTVEGDNEHHQLALTQEILLENLLREDEPTGVDEQGNEIYRTWRFSASAGWSRHYIRLLDGRWELVPGEVIVNGEGESERAEQAILVMERIREERGRLLENEDLGLQIISEHDLPEDFLPEPFSLTGAKASSVIVPASVNNEHLGEWGRDIANWSIVLEYYGYKLTLTEGGGTFKKQQVLDEQGAVLTGSESIALCKRILIGTVLRYASLLRILHLSRMAGSNEAGSVFSAYNTTPISVVSLDHVWRLDDELSKNRDDLLAYQRLDVEEARERITELAGKMDLGTSEALKLFNEAVYVPDDVSIMDLFSSISMLLGPDKTRFSYDKLKAAVRRGMEIDEKMDFHAYGGLEAFDRRVGLSRIVSRILPEQLQNRRSTIAWQIVKLAYESEQGYLRSVDAQHPHDASI